MGGQRSSVFRLTGERSECNPPRHVAMVSPEILERFPTQETDMAAAGRVFSRGAAEQWLTCLHVEEGPRLGAYRGPD